MKLKLVKFFFKKNWLHQLRVHFSSFTLQLQYLNLQRQRSGHLKLLSVGITLAKYVWSYVCALFAPNKSISVPWVLDVNLVLDVDWHDMPTWELNYFVQWEHNKFRRKKELPEMTEPLRRFFCWPTHKEKTICNRKKQGGWYIQKLLPNRKAAGNEVIWNRFREIYLTNL